MLADGGIDAAQTRLHLLNVSFTVKIRQKKRNNVQSIGAPKKKKKVKTNTKPKNWKQCKYISPSESPRVATFFFRFTWNHNANLDFSVERYWEVDGWEFPKLIITKWQRDNDAPLNSFVTVSLEFCSRWAASVYKLLNSDCGGIFFLKITGAHRPSFSCFEYVLYCFVNNVFLIFFEINLEETVEAVCSNRVTLTLDCL